MSESNQEMGVLSKPIHSKALYEAVEGITSAVMEPDAKPVQAEPTDGIYDWDAALSRVGGRTDLLRQMVILFFKESGKLLPEIQQAIRTADMAKLRRVAHALRGSADCFAAPSAVAAALRLEIMARDGILEDADKAFAELAREIERLKLALAAHVP